MTYSLCELSLGNRLTAELDVECVGARDTRGIHEADSAIPIINNVNVYITTSVAKDPAGDVTMTCLSSIYCDHTFLVDWDCAGDVIWHLPCKIRYHTHSKSLFYIYIYN